MQKWTRYKRHELILLKGFKVIQEHTQCIQGCYCFQQKHSSALLALQSKHENQEKLKSLCIVTYKIQNVSTPGHNVNSSSLPQIDWSLYSSWQKCKSSE